MTTKVTITNSSSGQESDRHQVGVAVLQSPDQVQVSSHQLASGESVELYVYPGQRYIVMELPPAPKVEKPKTPTQGTQN